ncbi:MAG: hypothetical protein M3N25_00360 [Actinomycetota bacterium]|nr:hypothetical protein [Actinomycetota bacterium]
MPEGPAPPFNEPTGPSVDDDAVLSAFARDEAAGHSPSFHVERPMLLVDRMVAAALRIGPRTVLVRADLPPDLVWAKERVERALADEGMTCFDEDTLLATPVVVQMIGLRASSWDLWGVDIDDAFAALRGAVVAEQPGPLSSG